MSEDEKIIQKILNDKDLLNKLKLKLLINEKKDIEYKSNEELIDFWLYSKAFTKKVKNNYRNIMNYFLTWLSFEVEKRDWNLQEVISAEIEQYKTWLERHKQLGMKTKQLYYTALKSFYEFYQIQSKRAKLWNFTDFPMFHKLNLNPGEIDVENEEHEIEILNPEQVKIYLKMIFRLDKKFYLIERFQYESGLRFIDVARIKKKFLRLNQRYLYTEGRRGFRCYFLSEELIKHVTQYAMQDNHELLFTIKGKQIVYNTYLGKLKKMLKKIDIPNNLSTKSGRKSFATNRHKFMQQSKLEISYLLGHKVKNVTDRYIITEIDDYLKKFDAYNYLKNIF
ncbi:MAG: site-specific integrase [Candidatus Lokiarchaeota archaeon]|nr:site-specific integrase [Candidatus Lokiarchaeota archaeon]